MRLREWESLIRNDKVAYVFHEMRLDIALSNEYKLVFSFYGKGFLIREKCI